MFAFEMLIVAKRRRANGGLLWLRLGAVLGNDNGQGCQASICTGSVPLGSVCPVPVPSDLCSPITETPNLPGGAHKSLRRRGKEPKGAQAEGVRHRENEERGLTGDDEHLRDPVAQGEREKPNGDRSPQGEAERSQTHTVTEGRRRLAMGRTESNGYLLE